MSRYHDTRSGRGTNRARAGPGQEASVTILIARTGVQATSATPASAGHDLASDIVNEVGPVGDESRVDVGDVHHGASRLALVVEQRKQLAHRCPHHLGNRVEISVSGDTKHDSTVAHQRQS